MSLVRLLFSIMVLKSKPQDIEFDPRITGATILLYVASGVFVLSRATQFDTAIYSMMLDAVVLAVFSAGCLALLQLQPRIVQVFAALFGTGIIYNLLAWPIFEQLDANEVADTNKSMLSLMFLLLLSWQILVNAHIYRHALSVDMTKAVVLSIAYWLMSMTLSQIVFPAP